MTLPIDPTGLITSSLASKFQDFVLDQVINKWRSYRAINFFERLVYEIAKEDIEQHETFTVNQLLEKFKITPQSEEILFEAYRRVCLSSTKDLGPKIIALLTARLLIEERIATEEEESIFVLAEEMRDVDFMEFCSFFESENLEEQLHVSSYDHLINVEGLGQHSFFKGSTTSHLTPTKALGKWAGKLEKVGFLYTDTLSDNHLRGSLNKQNQQSFGYHFSIVFEQSVVIFYKYIRRVQGPNS